MTHNEYRKLIANARNTTRRLNQTVAAGLHTAQSEPASAKTLDGGSRGETKSADRARVRFTICRQRLLDADNLAGGIKPLVDALRYTGCIRDDDPGSIALEVRQVKVRSKNEKGTLIEVTYKTKQPEDDLKHTDEEEK
jgi:hypothetical protein